MDGIGAPGVSVTLVKQEVDQCCCVVDVVAVAKAVTPGFTVFASYYFISFIFYSPLPW